MNEYHYKNIYVKGVSIGGIETCYILPHFKIAFDIGRCPYSLVDIPKVFLTHGHLDHASGLPYYISQRSLKHLPPPQIFVPETTVHRFKKILKLWNDIEDYPAQSEIIGFSEGEAIEVQKEYYVKAVPSYHRVDSQGYVLIRNVKKLKAEYSSCNSQEIVQLKKRKVDLFDIKDVPMFAFSGDTTIEFVLNHEIIQNTKVLFMECTYLDEKRDVNRAREWGHTHLDEIIQHADHFQNEKLVLVHLSRRYSFKKARQILDDRLPSKLKEKVDIFFG